MKWAHFAVGFFVGWLTLCLIAEIPKDVETTVDLSEQSENKPVKIVTRTNVIYIWPCGQVAKESLEILNENEEQPYYGVFSNGDDGDVEYTIVSDGEFIFYEDIQHQKETE